MKNCPSTFEAYRLLHQGSLALARIEHNGIRIDLEYLGESIRKISQQILDHEDRLRADPLYEIWRKRFGAKTNLGSREQLAEVIFGIAKYPSTERTATGKYKSDISAFEVVDLPFVKDYLRMQKLYKARGTYLQAIERETCEGFLHPSFDLHTVQTYRSSSNSPNFQNMPIRDKEIGRLIRTCFIPRSGNHLVEADYSGIEVRAATFYHKDPAMLAYIEDKTKDMHRDMAAECYLLDPAEVTKESRYCAKNQFVFPQFYGSYFLDCAKALWASIDRMALKTVSGIPLHEHLRSQGIMELGECHPEARPRPGTFEKHIQEVEKRFWFERFPVYTAWKQSWYESYQRTGSFQMLTGFRVEGLFRRNAILNYPVQGVAFHCLLASLIEVQKQLDRRKMKTLLVGQIHDSLLADVPADELQEYCSLVRQIMTEDIPRKWDWINTPLEVEIEVTPLDRSWYEKTEWIESNDIWKPKGTNQ